MRAQYGVRHPRQPLPIRRLRYRRPPRHRPPVSQVQDSFNGLGQLTAEYQSPAGRRHHRPDATPSVQYTYAGPSSTQNYSRLTTLTYPNSRILHDVYNGGLDAAVSRVSASPTTTAPATLGGHLADYSYLGLSTVVTEGQGNGNALTYVKQANDTTNAIQNGDPRFGGDQYAGLDRFGRVIDQNYVATATGTPTTRPDQHRPLPVRLRPGQRRPVPRQPGQPQLQRAVSRQNSTAGGDNNSTATGTTPSTA